MGGEIQYQDGHHMKPELYQFKFAQRSDRTRFILSQFRDVFTESVLDVGCYEAPLRKLLPDVRYLGLDMVGDPDVFINLEKVDCLPAADAEFNTVCCFEVLEHIDCLHHIFSELFRTARSNVLVSLPNCWCSARKPLNRGSGAIAHYGLPFDPPVDRHKWFLSADDIIKFFTFQAEKRFPGSLERIVAVENPRPSPVRFARSLRYPGMRYINRYAHTVIAHFKM